MKILKFALGYAIVLLLLLQSCTKSDSNRGNEIKDSGIRIAELTYEETGKKVEAVPVFKLGMDEIKGIINENHRLAKEGTVYKFENAWIESFKQDNGVDYFLAVSGESQSINDPADVGCHTLYSLMKYENGNLFFDSAGGEQHSCTGHKCSQCILKQNTNGFYCECTMLVDPTGYCDHSVISGGGGSGGK